MKQTQNFRGYDSARQDERRANDYRGDKCHNHAHAETKSSESRRARGDFGTADGKEYQGGASKRTSRSHKSRRERNTETSTRRTRRRSKPRKIRRINAPQCETSSRRKSSRASLHEDMSMLKHIMIKCQVTNYVDKQSSEWDTHLIKTKKLGNACQVAQGPHSGEAQHEPRGAQEDFP